MTNSAGCARLTACIAVLGIGLTAGPACAAPFAIDGSAPSVNFSYDVDLFPLRPVSRNGASLSFSGFYTAPQSSQFEDSDSDEAIDGEQSEDTDFVADLQTDEGVQLALAHAEDRSDEPDTDSAKAGTTTADAPGALLASATGNPVTIPSSISFDSETNRTPFLFIAGVLTVAGFGILGRRRNRRARSRS